MQSIEYKIEYGQNKMAWETFIESLFLFNVFAALVNNKC